MHKILNLVLLGLLLTGCAMDGSLRDRVSALEATVDTQQEEINSLRRSVDHLSKASTNNSDSIIMLSGDIKELSHALIGVATR